ncbi:MAG: CD225/dispanin family protein [Tannerella sp.]|jgi:uncharacterized integral membrane protein|nr:CD225/dispanin family protein [Tannerella sp.]
MEEKDYYYLRGETKVGPFSLEALKSEPIAADTLVWNSALPDWTAAGTLPELQGLFATQAPPPPPPASQPAPAYQERTFGGANVPPPMPESNLIWAILVTVLCCLPLGIVSIIHATKVSSAYNLGDYEGAVKASADAKKWAIWSAIAGVVVIVLYTIFAVIIAAGGIADEYLNS